MLNNNDILNAHFSRRIRKNIDTFAGNTFSENPDRNHGDLNKISRNEKFFREKFERTNLHKKLF